MVSSSCLQCPGCARSWLRDSPQKCRALAESNPRPPPPCERCEAQVRFRLRPCGSRVLRSGASQLEAQAAKSQLLGCYCVCAHYGVKGEHLRSEESRVGKECGSKC